MSKKGLSIEEKRRKMLELFYETHDVYQLKDLEKLAPKAKGITQQSVKDVLLQLVDDGLVDSEKIGTNVYYWSFPTRAVDELKKKVTDVNTALRAAETKIQQLEDLLVKKKASLENIDIITKLQNEVTLLKVERDELKKELAGSEDQDVDVITAKEEQARKLLEAANRWTDNIFYVKSWCKRKFDKEDKDLNKAFGIPDDFDYLQ